MKLPAVVRCVLLFVVALLVSHPLLAQRALSLAVTANQIAGSGAARVTLNSVGNENRVTFSLVFNPSVLRFDGVVAGADVGGGATLGTNSTQTASGRIGVDLALPAGVTFTAGSRQLVVLNFFVVATSNSNTTLGFSDAPTDAFIYTIGANTSTTSFSGVTLAAVTSTAAAAPLISTEPAGLTVTSGSSATFTVAATGPGALAYQWRRNGFAVAGATAASLTLAAVTRADADYYDVVVANSNGTATSAKVRLGVAPTSYPGFVAPDPAWALQPENDSCTITTLLPLADGRCYVSGAFLRASGLRRANVMRLLADGSVDPTFVPAETDNTVTVLAVQPDGKLVIAGFFSRVGGVLRNRLARLNTDGSDDTAFNFGGAGLANTVNAMAVQADGKIVIAGTFSAYNGVSSPSFIRLNPDGSRDLTFGLSLTGVTSLVAQADGKLLVGGSFSYSSAGTVYNRLLRLNGDGTVDPTLTIGAGFNAAVNVLRLQSDGKILVGGTFSTFNGAAALSVARLSANGPIDGTFTANVVPSGTASCLALLANGKIIVGGLTGSSAALVARLNANGSADTTFTAPAISSAPAAVFAQTDGRVLVGGTFTAVSGVTRYGLARLNVDGAFDTAYNLSMHGSASIGAMAALPDGKFLIARSFDYMRGAAVSSCLVRCNADGTLDPAFNPGGAGADAIINALLRQPDGKILITGNFTSYNGTAVGRIARLNADGTLDATFNVGGAGLDLAGNALGLQSGGRIVVAGTFTSVNGVGRNAPVARLNSNGSLDTFFSTPAIAGGAVETMLLQPDGRILLGGTFTSVNAVGFGRLARLNADGTLDASFGPSPGPGPNSSVYALALEPSGTILIGGTFTQYGTTSRSYLARLGPDGALFGDFNPVLVSGGGVFSILSQEDGKVIVRGSFTSAGGAASGTAFLARFNADGTRDTSFAAGGITSSGITHTGMLMRDDGQLFIPAGINVGLQVTRTATLPIVVTSPANQTIAVGGAATFSVLAASDAPATYQWFLNDVAIPGANSPNFTLSSLTAAAAGSYRVVVASELGAVTSTVATLTVPAVGGPFISTFAGTAGMSGTVDGVGPAARFARPYALAVDAAGYCYVADPDDHVIRKITPSGVVTTLAGVAGSSGSVDGAGPAARFNAPSGVAVDGGGNVYVADTNNHTIRRISPDGIVTTVVGSAGVVGSVDGIGNVARFKYPFGIAVDHFGMLYVSDTFNHTIRRIPLNGAVSTMAGSVGVVGSTDGVGTSARFSYPTGLAVDADGFVYVADAINSTIRKLTQAGVVTTYAGAAAVPGTADGAALTVARFEQPSGIAVDSSGVVYVADFLNDTIRRISVSGEVSTFAGLAGTFGSADGAYGAARFYRPTGVAVDVAGNLYIADSLNRTIRRSGAAILPPVIAAISAPRQTVVLGQNLTLSVAVTSGPAPTYQWKRNGFVIPGATGANYALTNATPVRDNGWYQAIVTNSAGVTTSATIFVNVVVDPAQVVAWGDASTGATSVPAGLTAVSAVAGGNGVSYALRADGTVAAWGSSIRPPSGLAGVVAISACANQGLALKADGTVVTWGNTVPAGLADVVSIACGSNHSVALKSDGTVVAWGENNFGQSAVPAGLSGVVAVSASYDHSLALKADGTVVAWGGNADGQSSVPSGLSGIVEISAGQTHSLARRSDGTLVAWGSGVGGATSVPAGLTGVVAITAGSYVSYALKADGTFVGWGGGSTVPAIGNVFALAAGASHAVALRNATVDVPPAFSGTATAVFDVDSGASFIIAATGSPSPTFSLVGGSFPAWATFNGTTGVISGQPPTATGSPFIFTVQASNGINPAATRSFTLTVREPPVITTQPTTQTVVVGQPVTFGIVASGTPSLTYQWRKNGAVISGATGANYTIPSVQMSDAGNYDVVVTNPAGITTSSVSVLSVVVPTPPTITSQPVGGTINLGDLAAFSVATTGSAPLAYQWRRNGEPISGATGNFFNIPNAQLSHAGDYTVVVTNPAGAVTSAVATLAFSPLTIARQPLATNLAPGSAVTLSVVASGASALGYQWRRNGISLAGATTNTFTLPTAQYTDAGTYDVVITNAQGTLTSAPAALTFVNRSVTFTSRLAVGIEGALAFFTVEGPAPKQLLLRAVGPGLAPLGVTGAMTDPQLEVFNSVGVPVASNDNWSNSPDAATLANSAVVLGAFTLATGSRDAAMLRTFAPGTYTLRVSAANGVGGIVLLELYDTDFAPATSSLPYVAVRGRMAPGNEVLIGGLAANGRAQRSFLLRAVGPTLGEPGAFANPSLNAIRESTLVGSNDDWDALPADATAVASATARVAAFPLPAGSRDAALVLTGNVHAGSHTVQVGGPVGASGTVLLELHDLDATRPGAFAPAIVSPPLAQTVAVGASFSLGVLAHGTAPLTYQWRKNGAALLDETGSTLTRSSAQLSDGGVYTATVTNALGTATSLPAIVTLTGSGSATTATHASLSGSYVPGGIVTLTNTLTYVGTASSLGWSVALPTGWSFVSQGGSVAQVAPLAGTTGSLELAWTAPPPSPVTFTYTLAIPAGETGPRTLAAEAIVRVTDAAPLRFPVSPAPLTLVAASSYHSADTDHSGSIGVFELTRVIELYNTRLGTTRTGRYQILSGTEDGFATDAITSGAAGVTLTRYHSADSNHDAQLSLTELTRVIELFNTRSGTNRTGTYHLQSATEDGFAPGP